LSSNPRPKLKSVPLKRVTPDTKFYVDYSWWDESNLDLKTYLYTRLNINQDVDMGAGMEEIDLIDPQTGEVRRVDGFQYIIQSYFNQLPPDFLSRASLVDAVFCVLLANANQPMSGRELAERVQRPIDMVIRTLGGPQIYQGIRPVPEED
jgi:hypothetical protein